MNIKLQSKSRNVIKYVLQHLQVFLCPGLSLYVQVKKPFLFLEAAQNMINTTFTGHLQELSIIMKYIIQSVPYTVHETEGFKNNRQQTNGRPKDTLEYKPEKEIRRGPTAPGAWAHKQLFIFTTRCGSQRAHCNDDRGKPKDSGRNLC
jgi:hypothetical protein